MKHTLRKYLSSRGSALFMVLSTMTALLIVVMAMYFSVVSSRSVQYAVFNQEQSYQSSISVADAVIAGLNDGKLDKLSGEFFKLNVGETKSTNGNGFASLTGGTGKEDDPKIGAYDVTVTRLNDEGDFYVYDFVVTAMVNGVTETTHTLVRLSAAKPTPPPAGKTFTATGYLPNENWLGLGYYYDEVHIDSEYVVMGMNTTSVPYIYGDLTCAGSVEMNNIGASASSSDAQNSRVWAIGGNLKMTDNISSSFNHFNLNGTSTEHGLLIVGGDLNIARGNADGGAARTLSIPANTDVYVVGDVYMKQLGTSGGNLFVGGHLYLEEDFNFNGSSGNVYLSNMDDFTPSDKIHSWLDSGSYSTPDSPSPLFTKSEIIDKLNTAIGSNSYPKWIPEVETEAVVNIAFNSNWQDIPDPYDSGKIIPNSSRVFESEALKYSETNKSCIIGNIYDVGDKTVVPQIPWYNGDGTIGGYGDNSGAAGGNYYIIIDTGDNPNNVFTVRLLANRDFVNGVESPEDNRAEKYDNDPANKEENETFSWAPYPNNLTSGGKFTNVLIKGRGTVIFDIPEGVTYQASTFEFVGHMNWYALSSMGNDFKNNSAKDNVLKLVHTSCTGSNACDYTDKYDDGKPVEGGFWCKTHECVVESTAESVEKLKDSFEDGVCLCHNRVGRKEIDAIPKPDVKVTSAGTDYELVDYVGEGDARTFVYPTTNVWFVSCDENAEIRLSETIDGLGIMHDNTFGFIYAPYMTFSAKTFDLTGGLRMVGGLIVSDLLMSDFYTFLYVAPEKNYADLLGDNAPSLLPQGNRTWRKYGY